MTALATRAEEYLALRRAVGFKLERAGLLLADFVGFAEGRATDVVTVEVAVAWATSATQASPVWVSQRLGVVRRFARWLQTLEPATEVPPTDLLAARTRRATPYLYSSAEIDALMAAARQLADPLRAATFEAFIGLLAVTGMRGGEAMRLDRDDLDADQALLSVRSTKFGKSRLVPLHPATVGALQRYAEERDRLCPRPSTPSFFVSASGDRLRHSVVQPTFRRLLERAGITCTPPSRHPSVHQLRHSFAVATLLGWYQADLDVQTRLPVLSTYLGHVDPARTYWYLSASPELLAFAARRLETVFGDRP